MIRKTGKQKLPVNKNAGGCKQGGEWVKSLKIKASEMESIRVEKGWAVWKYN